MEASLLAQPRRLVSRCVKFFGTILARRHDVAKWLGVNVVGDPEKSFDCS